MLNSPSCATRISAYETEQAAAMPVMKHDGIGIYYEVQGSGSPLLLIAGLASDNSSWLPVLPGLARHYSVIVFDNRGVGRSTQECETSIPLMAEDCRALLQHLGLERALVAGHSMGGMVALEMALRFPELVEKMALIATTASNPARNNLLFRDWADWYESGLNRTAWFRNILAWIMTERFFENRQLVADLLDYLLNYPWPQSAKAFRQQVQAIAAYDAENRLHLVNVPTCVMAAGLDMLMPFVYSRQLAERIPGAELLVLEDTAHSIHTEQPDLFVIRLLEFMYR